MCVPVYVCLCVCEFACVGVGMFPSCSGWRLTPLCGAVMGTALGVVLGVAMVTLFFSFPVSLSAEVRRDAAEAGYVIPQLRTGHVQANEVRE